MRAFTSKAGRFVALLAIIAALFFAIAACGNNDDDDYTPAVTQPPVATTAPGDTVTPEPPPVVNHDEPPRVIRVISWYLSGMAGALGHHEVHGGAPDPDESTNYELDRMRYENMLRVMREFNVEFDIISSMDYEAHAESFIAGQLVNAPIGEVVHLSPSMMPAAFLGNHVNDMRALGIDGMTYIRSSFEYDGGIWAMRDLAPNVQSFWLAFNYDLGNRLGIPSPVEMYQAGNWTWAAMMEMAETAQSHGYFGLAGWGSSISQMIIASNNGMLADANFNVAYTHPNTMAALEFMVALYQNNHVWPGVGNPDLFWDWNLNSLDSLVAGEALFYAIEFWHPDSAFGPDYSDQFEFRVVPFPQGPNGTGYAGLVGFNGGWVIPHGVEDPEFVLRVLEELKSWPGEDIWLVTEGAMGWPRGATHTEECAQLAVNIADTRRLFDPGMAVGIERGLDIVMGVLEYGETISEAIGRMQGGLQEMMDDFFGR
ncbi:MAG: ABC transporter substrate-binding protein [Defluviitaleaceae bacterium]|nr:ABC transporter substrate-binding protein [Defluviitaleaceae bacterium]